MENRIHNFKSFIGLNESKSDGTSIIIGDSCTPNIFRRSKTLTMLGTAGSEENLWKGGIGVKWLKTAVSKHPVETKVKDVVINIGTNGAFGPNDDIKGLMTELRRVFPQAKFSAVQGSWGWGGNISVTPDKVKKYYDRFKAEGVTVIEPPIGKVADPHSNLPVYDTIAKEIDGLVTNQSGYIAPSDLEIDNSATTQIISRSGDVYSYKVKDDHWLAKKDSQSRWNEITGTDFKPAYQVSIDILDRENPNMRSNNAPKKGEIPGGGTIVNKYNQVKNNTKNSNEEGNITEDVGTFIYSYPKAKLNNYTLVIVFGGINYANPKWMFTETPKALFSEAIFVFVPYTVPYADAKKQIDAHLTKKGMKFKEVSILGFSAGALNVQRAFRKDFKFIGLIDPSTRSEYINIPFTNNTKMVYNDSNWSGLAKIKEALPKIAKSVENGGGDSEKVSLSHAKIPSYFFNKYKDQIV
jgi:hypothetical protein